MTGTTRPVVGVHGAELDDRKVRFGAQFWAQCTSWEDFSGAVSDCEETLRRNPHHFGALSGQGLCHMALGQYREAAALFRRTLAVHPSLASASRNLGAAMGEAVKGNGH